MSNRIWLFRTRGQGIIPIGIPFVIFHIEPSIAALLKFMNACMHVTNQIRLRIRHKEYIDMNLAASVHNNDNNNNNNNGNSVFGYLYNIIFTKNKYYTII